MQAAQQSQQKKSKLTPEQRKEEKKKVALMKASQRSKAIKKAQKTAKLSKKGAAKKKFKTRTKIRFYRPKTLQLTRNPKYQKKASAEFELKEKGYDKYNVILQPLATEKAMKKMEEENTMVYLVHALASKPLIKDAFQKMYNVKVRSVNTLFRPDGKKKAYIRLSPESDSLTLANKIGII